MTGLSDKSQNLWMALSAGWTVWFSLKPISSACHLSHCNHRHSGKVAYCGPSTGSIWYLPAKNNTCVSLFLQSSLLSTVTFAPGTLSACLMVWQWRWDRIPISPHKATLSPFIINHFHTYAHVNQHAIICCQISQWQHSHSLNVILFFFIACNRLIVQLHITRASMSSFTHGQAFRLALFSETL